MSFLIVGGDRLGKIPDKLNQIGADSIKHISGRKCNKCKMPSGIDVVLVLTDYVSHSLSESIKCKAKGQGTPIIFCRRSWACIYKKLDFCGMVS